MGKFLNKISLLRDYRKGRVGVRSFPTIVHAELTNACNLKCVICPRNRMSRPVGYMDMSLVAKIAGEIRGKSDLVVLYGWGESLFHPRFEEAIAVFKEHGIATQLSTNAAVLTPERTERLLESGLDFLILSLDAVSRETYRRLRPGCDFNKTMENARHFLSEARRRESKTFCVAQIIYTRENRAEVPAFRREWRKLGAKVWVKPYSTWSGEDERFRDLKPDGGGEYRSNLCQWPWFYFLVHWNGNVVPCCFDYDEKVVFGNASEKSLAEIWNGEALREFRAAHLRGRESIPFCRKCDFVSWGPFKQASYLGFDYLTALKLQTYFENYSRLNL